MPALRKKWIGKVVKYIHKKYGNPPSVHAIVVPDTRGMSFGIAIALQLDLPYISIHEDGEVSAHSDEIKYRANYINRKNKVNCYCLLFKIYRCHSIWFIAPLSQM